MRIDLEIADPESCLNRAEAGEIVFVLLARDATAPAVIEEWVKLRLLSGKNDPGDEQIVEAQRCAVEMRMWRIGRTRGESPDAR